MSSSMARRLRLSSRVERFKELTWSLEHGAKKRRPSYWNVASPLEVQSKRQHSASSPITQQHTCKQVFVSQRDESSCLRNCWFASRMRRISARKRCGGGYIHSTYRRFTISSARTRVEDYAANGGTIEGVWVFHRHGDRAPSTPLCFEEDVQMESDFWQAKLPKQALMDDLNRKFPLKLHKSWGDQHLDSPRYPWGALTMLGAMQMHRVGDKFYHRYSRYPYGTSAADAASKETLRRPLADNERLGHFLDHWDIICYSTNYLRTVTSARSFLDGMLFGRSNPHFKEYGARRRPDEFRHAARYPGRFTLGRHDFVSTPDIFDSRYRSSRGRISNGTTSASLFSPSFAPSVKIPIHVRTKQSDPLNAFDRNFDLMMELIGDVVNQPSFQEGDSSALRLAEQLVMELPGLRNSVRFGGPSGINWVHAADHFVCRSSHGMKLSGLEPIYSVIGDDEAFISASNTINEDPMQALSGPTMKHLAWRFRQWYTSAPLLAEFAGPPLREIVLHAKLCLEAQQQSSLPSSSQNAEADEDEYSPHVPKRGHRPFVIYSCHDVSILSLLYGIQAKLVVDDQYSKYWPPYSSTLVFELVRLDDDFGNVSSAESTFEKHFVRILLNGKPIAIHGNPRGNILSLEEFDHKVEHMIGGRELTVHPHDPSMFVSSRHGGVL